MEVLEAEPTYTDAATPDSDYDTVMRLLERRDAGDTTEITYPEATALKRCKDAYQELPPELRSQVSLSPYMRSVLGIK